MAERLFRSADPNEKSPFDPVTARKEAEALAREMRLSAKKVSKHRIRHAQSRFSTAYTQLLETLDKRARATDSGERAKLDRKAKKQLAALKGPHADSFRNRIAQVREHKEAMREMDEIFTRARAGSPQDTGPDDAEDPIIEQPLILPPEPMPHEMMPPGTGEPKKDSLEPEEAIRVMQEAQLGEEEAKKPAGKPPASGDDTLDIMRQGEASVEQTVMSKDGHEAREKLREMIAKFGQPSLEGNTQENVADDLNKNPADASAPKAGPGTLEARHANRVDVSKERAALRDSERELIKEESDFYSKNGKIGRIFKRALGRTGKINRLEGEMNTKATAYEGALEKRLAQGVEDAMTRRNPNSKLTPEEYKQRFAEKYRRLHAVKDVIAGQEIYKIDEKTGKKTKEVVGYEGGERARYDAQVKAIESRGVTSFEAAATFLGRQIKTVDTKLTGWTSRLLQAAGVGSERADRVGQITARTIRVLGMAAIGTGAAAGIGALTAATLGGVAAAPTLGAFLFRGGRGLASMFGGGAAAGLAGRTYEKTLGARHAGELKNLAGTVAESPEHVAAKRKAYQKGSSEAIARKRRNIEMGTALGISGVAAYELWQHPQLASFLNGHGNVHPDSFAYKDEPGYVPPEMPAPSHSMGTGPVVPEAGYVSPEMPAQVHTGPIVPEAGYVPPEMPAQPHVPPEMPAPSHAGEMGPGILPSQEHLPDIEVKPIVYSNIEAGNGHGYEWMLKRLYEENKYMNPNDFPPGSDMRALLEANDSTIDKVVHQMAAADKHHFFHAADGSSVLIEKGAHMTVDENGEVHVGSPHMADTVQAPAEAKTTSPYHAGATGAQLEAHARASMAPLTDEKGFIMAEQQSPAPEHPAPNATWTPSESEQISSPVVQPQTPTQPGITVDVNNVPSLVPRPAGDLSSLFSHHEAVPAAAAPATPELQAPPWHEASPQLGDHALPEHLTAFTNHLKVQIDPTHGHVFGAGKGPLVYAYGNNYADRILAAQDYVQGHHDATVLVQAEKPVFYNGAWRPWVMEVKYANGVQILNPDAPTNPQQIGAIDPEKFDRQLS